MVFARRVHIYVHSLAQGDRASVLRLNRATSDRRFVIFYDHFPRSMNIETTQAGTIYTRAVRDAPRRREGVRAPVGYRKRLLRLSRVGGIGKGPRTWKSSQGGSSKHERARDSVVITLPRFFRGDRLLIPRMYMYARRAEGGRRDGKERRRGEEEGRMEERGIRSRGEKKKEEEEEEEKKKRRESREKKKKKKKQERKTKICRV